MALWTSLRGGERENRLEVVNAGAQRKGRPHHGDAVALLVLPESTRRDRYCGAPERTHCLIMSTT